MLWVAWHNAYYQRVKQLPKLQDELQLFDGHKPKRMAQNEMLAAVIRMNKAFGGKDLRKNHG